MNLLRALDSHPKRFQRHTKHDDPSRAGPEQLHFVYGFGSVRSRARYWDPSGGPDAGRGGGRSNGANPSPEPNAPPSKARVGEGRRLRTADPAGGRTRAQAERAGAQTRQQGLWKGRVGPFVKLSGVLMLELTGVFFGIFALCNAPRVERARIAALDGCQSRRASALHRVLRHGGTLRLLLHQQLCESAPASARVNEEDQCGVHLSGMADEIKTSSGILSNRSTLRRAGAFHRGTASLVSRERIPLPGHSADMYRGRLWTMRQYAGIGTRRSRTGAINFCSRMAPRGCRSLRSAHADRLRFGSPLAWARWARSASRSTRSKICSGSSMELRWIPSRPR